MSRYQDTVIDDDEESCPLCIEEFDLFDKNFRPCPCGYQICQFCFNSLKTTYEKSTCPNCRRPYDESTIQYKMPTAEELKNDQLNKNKKLAAAKRKETEKREVENSNRRNLAGVRVKQQNLVYVIGLEPAAKKDEATLMETLRGKDFFGQYGPIEKIVVSKPKSGAINQSVGVYVTFKNKEDAATCINCVDGSQNGDKILRAQYGTTKYCSTYLRGEVCQNKNCSFLHETGEDGASTSLQNEPIEPRPKHVPRSQPTPQPHSSSQAMTREGSREGATSRQGSTDGSALPPSAGWANAPVVRARRASQAASTSTASPQLAHSALAYKRTESKISSDASPAQPSQTAASEPPPATPPRPPTPPSATKPEPESTDPIENLLRLIKNQITTAINDGSCSFQYDDSCVSEEIRSVVARLPPLIDPYGGAKRRIMQDKEDEKNAKLAAEEKHRVEEQATSAAEDAMDEETMAAGSLALGGEPEENPRSASARGTIGRPTQPTPTSSLPIDQLSNLKLNRSLTPQQRQQLMMLNAGSGPNSRVGQGASPNTAFEMSDFDRRAPQYSQAQYDQISSHARHGSRYFNNDSKASNNRFPSQQQPYFSSGVQGPPPGLPTAGTPPVSGGGMFAHGQGFTSSGFGSTKENTDPVRTRAGTTADNQIKRESFLSLNSGPLSGNPLRSPPTSATAPGVLNGMYGQYPGAYQDPTLVKQKRKGKKQRHANTSSSGGGVDHLAADPSILTARVHQGAAGQGIFGGNQGDRDFPPLPKPTDSQSATHSRVSSIQSSHVSRSGTPKIPPGLERTLTPTIPPGFENRVPRPGQYLGLADLHAHPLRRGDAVDKSSPKKESQATVTPVVPVIPNLPISRKVSIRKDSKSDSPDVAASLEHPVSFEGQQTEAPLDNQRKSVPETDDNVAVSADDVSSGPLPALVADVRNDQQPIKPTNPDLQRPDQRTRAAQVTEERTESPNVIESTKHSAASTQSDPPTTTKESKIDETSENKAAYTPDAASGQPTSSPKKSAEAKIPPLRTLQITSEMIARNKSQAPPSTTTEGSAALPTVSHIRQDSRQPSVSTSRPSTPAASDLLASHDVSRAGSPQPSLVGYAPSRGKSKAQTKKERKKKANEISETSSAIAASTPPAQEEVGPIVARQKKQKKAKSSGAAGPAESTNTVKEHQTHAKEIAATDRQVRVSEAASDTPKEQEREEIVAEPAVEPAQETPASPQPPELEPEEPLSSYTLRDYYNDAARIEAKYDAADSSVAIDEKAIQREIQDLLASRISPLPLLLSEMIADGDITPDHPLLTAPSFNSSTYKLPTDHRKGQAYLDGNGYTSSDAFGMVYLPLKEKKTLYHGHAVSVADSGERSENLLRRCLITPSGWVLRHLTKGESEKMLDLEERRNLYLEEYEELGQMDGLGRLEDDDYINLDGGFEELNRFGGNHGICWISGSDSVPNRRRYARKTDENGLENDYGLGETPVDPAAEFDIDEYDEADEEDEDELAGENLVLGARLDDNQFNLADNEEEVSYSAVSDQPAELHTTLPPLPEMVNAMSMPGAWETAPGYAARATQHGMYSSLNTPNVMAYPPPDAAGLELPPPPPLPPTSQLFHAGGRGTKLPPMRHPHSQSQRDAVFKYRAMDIEQLEKIVKERAKEIEVAKKDTERFEKMLAKRNKEAIKWKDMVMKGAAVAV